jgi:hypothetical protein
MSPASECPKQYTLMVTEMRYFVFGSELRWGAQGFHLQIGV